MNIGEIYDLNVATHYDDDSFGLLSGTRNLAYRQIKEHVGTVPDEILDVAVGTGEALVKMHKFFPDASLHGIDISQQMLAIAKSKLAFNAIHDSIVNATQHFSPASIDLILMHFLLTYIDGSEVLLNTAKLLKPGSYFSLANTLYGGFPKIHDFCLHVVSEEFIRNNCPIPIDNAHSIASLQAAGLEIIAVETFTKNIYFNDFPELYHFGLTSGFFTHMMAQCDNETIQQAGRIENVFPLDDHYEAVIVLARKS
jgi:ubiquinone/menaquinone biosynthesis C-methylase UbiE